QALVLRRAGIAARDEHAPVRAMCAGRPDLLAVDHPRVAVTHRARAQAREVGTGGRLGEELAPDLLPVQCGRRIAPLLLLGRVGEERRHAHAEADLEVTARRDVLAFLLVPDHLLDGRAGAPAVLLRPRDAREARLGLATLIVLRFREPVLLAIARVPRLERAAF